MMKICMSKSFENQSYFVMLSTVYIHHDRHIVGVQCRHEVLWGNINAILYDNIMDNNFFIAKKLIIWGLEV